MLVNPNAGNGRSLQLLSKIEAALSTLPLCFRTVITHDVNEAQQQVTQATQLGEYVATVGGDGTVRAIAGILSQLKGKLAVIPTGRGNDLVRMLKVPLDPISACRILAHGNETHIDMAKINASVFLGICSLGLDSIANQLANQTHFIKGRAVYLYGGLRALFKWKPVKFRVIVDDVLYEHEGYTVAVANSQNYGGGMYLAPDASIQDGLLDIVLIGKAPKLRILLNIPRLFKGDHINDPAFRILRGRHVRIEADPEFTVFADGDSICAPPADITILPKALHVIVP